MFRGAGRTCRLVSLCNPFYSDPDRVNRCRSSPDPSDEIGVLLDRGTDEVYTDSSLASFVWGVSYLGSRRLLVPSTTAPHLSRDLISCKGWVVLSVRTFTNGSADHSRHPGTRGGKTYPTGGTGKRHEDPRPSRPLNRKVEDLWTLPPRYRSGLRLR